MAVRKYTVVTPIPGFIPRQLALDILHSHSETITLNPLVLSHRQIAAPRDAAAEEYFSTWYEITERVQYVPGLGRLGSGVIRFNGCFHDLPWGLQTHIYAPAGVDLRVRYRIGGNQPGVEPPQSPSPAELGLAGLSVPRDGLYLREDIEIKCNIAMVGLVKSQMKAASKEMVARIIKKAELLDAGVLQAMIEDGKIRTHNPRDKTYTGGGGGAISPPDTPFSPPLSPSVPYQVPRPISFQQQSSSSRPGTSSSAQCSTYGSKVHYQHAAELPSTETSYKPPQGTPAVVMELPGDFQHASPHLQPPPQPSSIHPMRDRTSTATSRLSQQSSDSWRWSGGAGGAGGVKGVGQGVGIGSGQNLPSPPLNSSRPTSYSSDAGGGGGGFGSPGLNSPGFATELPTHRETLEEHHRAPRPPSGAPAPGPYRAYNPADYARVSQ
ncbi:hypothetical protein SLS62_002531 [Diatrype stigma]|uniref:DUF7053 domain-containing protein n=1 Tax=Diatrype stigma TaxID=117547 RepID=A0AAN9UXY2_9PEZI